MMHYADLHADTLTEIPAGESLWENSCNVDLKRTSDFAGRYIQVFALWKNRAETQDSRREQTFMELYRRAAALLKEQEERLMWCRNTGDMLRAHSEGKAAAFLSVEDISLMGTVAERIGELGIRFAMLTWNHVNEYGCGAAAGQEKGLTRRGEELAEELLRQGVVLDISHLSDAGTEQLFNLTEEPLIASHSNVRTVCEKPRNLKREYIRELIRRRGLVGMNFYAPFIGKRADMADLIRHMDAVLNLGGEDVLALGGDFDGCGNDFVQGVAGVQSMPGLRKQMLSAGFGERLADKIFFDNANRFIMEHLV